MKHLAIFSKNIAERILSGQKTVESRFSKARLAPFGVINPGDLVYIKPSGKDIIGQFRVKKVISYQGIDIKDIKVIKEVYGQEIVAGEAFWSSHQNAKYGTLIFIEQVVEFLTSPIKIPKKDLRGWVVLN